MNQNHSFMPAHGQMAHPSVDQTTTAPPQYAGYQTHQPMQHAMPPYAPSPIAYQSYGTYPHGMPMPNGPNAHMVNAPMGLPGKSSPDTPTFLI